MILTVKNLLFKYSKSKLVQGTFIVTLVSLVSNVLAYLFQLIIGRALTTEDYGILIAFFSLQSIISLPLNIVANTITKVVSEVKDINYPDDISTFYYSLIRINVSFVSFLFVILWFLKPYLLNYLNVTNDSLYLPFLFYVSTGLIFLHTRSFLQALQRYKAFSLLNFLVSFAKLFTSLVVFYYALDLKSVFLILAFSIFISHLLGYVSLLKNINKRLLVFSNKHFKRIVAFSVASSLTFIGINLIFNNDILLVKHLFSPELAGIYSSSAVIGRIIFYGVSPIAMVLFPICAEKYFKKEDFLTPLLKGVTVVLILSILGFVVFSVFPGLVVSILFGSRYIESVKYLPLYSLFMVFYSASAVTSWLLVSISKLKLGSLAIIFAGIQYFSIKFYFNESIQQILIVSTVVSALLFTTYITTLLLEYRREGEKVIK